VSDLPARNWKTVKFPPQNTVPESRRERAKELPRSARAASAGISPRERRGHPDPPPFADDIKAEVLRPSSRTGRARRH